MTKLTPGNEAVQNIIVWATCNAARLIKRQKYCDDSKDYEEEGATAEKEEEEIAHEKEQGSDEFHAAE